MLSRVNSCGGITRPHPCCMVPLLSVCASGTGKLRVGEDMSLRCAALRRQTTPHGAMVFQGIYGAAMCQQLWGVDHRWGEHSRDSASELWIKPPGCSPLHAAQREL